MKAGESHTHSGLDLFVVLECGDLHLNLQPQQGWQFLCFNFESANCINCKKLKFLETSF